MTPTLIRLPNGDYVNPAHVVSVRFSELHEMDGGPSTYIQTPHTYGTISLPGDQRDEVAQLINNTPTP